MGYVSKTISVRFKNVHKYASDLRRKTRRIRAPIPKDVKTMQELVESGNDPLFAVYAAVQNLTSVFSEGVSQFKELEEFYNVIDAAEDEYMPSGPPMSPLTGSYFTTWAYFDVRFGREKRKPKPKKKKQPRPERPLPLKWEFGQDIPTYDFIKDYRLDDPSGVEEAVEDFIQKTRNSKTASTSLSVVCGNTRTPFSIST